MQSRTFSRLSALLLCVSAGLAQPSAPLSYYLETIAGGDFAGDGGPAAQALLVQTEGIAVDARGNVYIADAGDHRVRRISSSGTISTIAGTGRAGFSGDGGPAVTARLNQPYGLAVDRTGNLYIADLGNARIRRVSTDGTISTIAGGGVLTPVEGRIPTEAALTMPRNVAFDPYGILHFSDFGAHRVYVIRESGVLGVIAGTGEPGLAGDGGVAAAAKLNSPAGIAIDPGGSVLIADSANSRIRKVWRGVITTLGASGLPLSTPVGLALDPDGSLFVADVGGNQVLRVTPLLATTPVAQPARDIAIDAQGNLYACSGPLVYRRPRAGGSVLIAGSVASSYVGDGGVPERARFQEPAGVARDSAGNVYVADTANHRIRKITPDNHILTIAGNGLRGFGGDGKEAVGAQLDTPVGVAVDSSGNLYIGDSGNHRIRKVDPTGIITTIAGTGQRGRSLDGTAASAAALDTPTWLAFAADGSLYLSETGGHAVRRITGAGILETAAGTGVRGHSGDGGSAVSAALDSPQGIAIDANGNLFIADAGNRRIRRVAAPSAYGPPLIATVPDANAAIWRGLRGIAAARDGRLFVTDADDSRVFRVDGPGQVLTIAGTGAGAFTAEAGPALQQALNAPSGITVDAGGVLYVADSANNRIRRLTPIQDAQPQPPPASTGITVVNAASLQPGSIAPGEILTIFGSGLSAGTDLSATQVLLNGKPGALFYVSPSQINVQAPYSVTGSVDIQVISAGLLRARGTVDTADAAPGIFTAENGTGQAAALNQDGSYNSETNPIARGSVIVLFATGEGKTNPTSVEGRAAGYPAPVPVLPVKVKIGGYDALIEYAGAAPGFAGLMQINARVPGGFLPPGRQTVTLQVGTAVSQPGVTVSLK